MVRWSDGQMVRWSDGQMVRWSDGQMVRWSDGQMITLLTNFLHTLHFPVLTTQFIAIAILLLVILVLGAILYWSFKHYLNKRINKTETEAKYQYLNIFTQHRIFRKLFYLIPACFAYWAIDIFILPSSQTDFFIKAIKEINELFILLIITLTANSIINACTQYSSNLSDLKSKPGKSYGQVIKLFIWFLFIILGLSVLLHKSPWGSLTGLGAVSALLMFIFKDTILEFVSSILITTDDIVRVDDWIKIPQFNANGNIIELSINTAKIQNFDNTYFTIPTSSIVTSYVKNWRGMYEAGGRRIQRHLNIDVNTIQYFTPELLTKLTKSTRSETRQSCKIIKNDYN